MLAGTSTAMKSIAEASLGARGVALRWADGSTQVWPSLWLRDNCRCPSCRHPGNGQKLYEITDFAPDLQAAFAGLDAAGDLRVEWPDGHRSSYTKSWLAAHRLDPASHAARRQQPERWDASIAADLPRAAWPALLADPGIELAWLERYCALGFGLLHDLPCQSGMVASVGDRLGHVRVTNYGRLFDVKSVPHPNNLADTALGLGAHSDNPYRDPSPGIQLLHCLECEAPGGDTFLVDGFKAADLLRQEDPAGFDLLCQAPMNFRYASADAELCARQTLISLDVDGEVCAVHFNNRSADWLDAPSEIAEPWYRAYLAFAHIIKRAPLEVRFRLDPGDCVVMRNDRTLHGRSAFDPNLGRRHLQGCYIDRDGVESRRLVLRRKLAA